MIGAWKQQLKRTPDVKRFAGVVALALAALAICAPHALAQQTLNLSVGYSMTRDERAATDILVIEHHDLAFDYSNFNSWTFGGEWLAPIGDLFEAGGGVAFSRKTVPTVHVGTVNADGSAIPRELRQRQMPIAVTLRVLPLRQSYTVQPYAGGGIALINWSFAESGDFAPPNTRQMFRNEDFSASGVSIGPVLLGGLRVAGESMAFGLEGRYQRAQGSFGPVFAHTANPDIDLGGWTLSLTAGRRIGKAPPAIRR
jgi:hypothetical protein